MVTLKEYKKEKIAINTRTQEEYDSLMRFFDEKDKKWISRKKATEYNYFEQAKEELCIFYNKVLGAIEYSQNKRFYKKLGYKIITPNQLKEYNEFMWKQETISTSENSEPLFISKGFKITNKAVEGSNFIVELDQYLNIGEAINWMLESEDNVIEYYDTNVEETCEERIKNNKLQIRVDNEWFDDASATLKYQVINWINIKKHIEPKQTTKETKTEGKIYTSLELFKQGKAFVEITNEDSFDIACGVVGYKKEDNCNGFPFFITYNKKFKCFNALDDSMFKHCLVRHMNMGEARRFLTEIKGIKEIKLEDLEPKQKTLKEKLEDKEPFIYKDIEYKFNTNGVILEPKGGAMSLDKIKELLKQCEE